MTWMMVMMGAWLGANVVVIQSMMRRLDRTLEHVEREMASIRGVLRASGTMPDVEYASDIIDSVDDELDEIATDPPLALPPARVVRRGGR